MIGPWTGRDLERFAEGLFLAVPAWPLVRIALGAPRAEHREGMERVVGAVAAAYLLAVVVGVVFFPELLRLAALMGLVAVAAGLWLSRTGIGRSRGLPPGGLAPLRLAPWLDHLYFRKKADRLGPVFKTMYFVKPMICVTGLERSIQLLRQFDDHLKGPFLAFNKFVPKGFLRYMDRDDHERYREWFRVAFSPQVAARAQEDIAGIVEAGLAEMARESPVEPGCHLAPMVNRIFLRLFLGFEPESSQFSRLEALYREITVQRVSRDARIEEALEEIRAIVERRAETIRQALSKGGQVPSSSLHSLMKLDPRLIQDPSVSGNLIYILQTGAADVSNLLRWLLKTLNDNPEWKRRLQLSTKTQDYDPLRPGLEQRVIMETLRMEQSEYLYRRIARRFRFQGFTFPRGWRLRVCIRESHRDPRIFENPATFDPDRFLHRRFSRSEYSPFGASRIACLGVHFTYAVGIPFLRQLCRDYRWAATADGPRQWGGWHWRPSSSFRIGLTRTEEDRSD